MTKEELIKRQAELKEQFDATDRERIALIEKLKEMEAGLNQLSGAYQEVTRQIKNLEEPKSNEN